VLDPTALPRIRDAIRERTAADRAVLDELREDVRPLAAEVRTIKPRSTTAVSVVASDGGNNQLAFDPFFVQLVRVVDSHGQELCLDAVSPSSDTDELSARQLDRGDGTPTALGRLMKDLGVERLSELSTMIPTARRIREEPDRISPGWVLTYRDLCEWAIVYEAICHREWGSDTLVIRDGLLRSKIFAGDLFTRMGRLMEAAIARHAEQRKRRVYLVGLAKGSKVIARYHLAMAIERTLAVGEPCFVRIPRKLEVKAYRYDEWARGNESTEGEAPKFVLGDMHLVRFGKHTGDPVWAVDILSSQTANAAEIMGYLLADAVGGFPVPLYPRALQRAHEFAQIVGFDLTILQDEVMAAVREILPPERPHLLEELSLMTDVANLRYAE